MGYGKHLKRASNVKGFVRCSIKKILVLKLKYFFDKIPILFIKIINNFNLVTAFYFIRLYFFMLLIAAISHSNDTRT